MMEREAQRVRQQFGRELNEAEVREVERFAQEDGVTVVLRELDHQTLSRTYAGRNTATQIAADAQDLAAAFRDDCEAILSGLRRDGRLNNEIVGAYLVAYQRNVARGVFNYNQQIDAMIQSFLR